MADSRMKITFSTKITRTPVPSCDCEKYPVVHDARWCVTTPDPLAWDEFEAYTLSEWARN